MVAVNIPDQFSVKAYGHTLSAADLNDTNVALLIELGYALAVRAAGSISKEKKADKTKEEIAALQQANRDKRAGELVQGIRPSRAGSGEGKTSPLARVMRAVARERLKALCQAQGVKMLVGDNLKAGLEAILKAQGDDITREAHARMAASAAAGEALKAAGITV